MNSFGFPAPVGPIRANRNEPEFANKRATSDDIRDRVGYQSARSTSAESTIRAFSRLRPSRVDRHKQTIDMSSTDPWHRDGRSTRRRTARPDFILTSELSNHLPCSFRSRRFVDNRRTPPPRSASFRWNTFGRNRAQRRTGWPWAAGRLWALAGVTQFSARFLQASWAAPASEFRDQLLTGLTPQAIAVDESVSNYIHRLPRLIFFLNSIHSTTLYRGGTKLLQTPKRLGQDSQLTSRRCPAAIPRLATEYGYSVSRATK